MKSEKYMKKFLITTANLKNLNENRRFSHLFYILPNLYMRKSWKKKIRQSSYFMRPSIAIEFRINYTN